MDSYTIYYGLTFIAIIITLSAQWYVALPLTYNFTI